MIDKEERDGAKLGFVGLGKMGSPMAANLVPTCSLLVVRDSDPEKQASFAIKHGCISAEAPAAFRDCDFVITMLPDDRDVQQVMLEWEGGIAAALSPQTIVIDMSSSNPRGTRSLGRDLTKRGLALIDAPVSGGVPRAESGTLSIMVGGDDVDAISRAEPILRTLGDSLFRTGPLGSGHAMKALNNFVAAATYTASAEALAVGQRFGLQASKMVEVFNASTARSFISSNVLAEHVVTGIYKTGFTLGLLAKDVGIATDLAESVEVEAPTFRLVNARWSQALDALGFAADHSEAHKQWWDYDFTRPTQSVS